MGVLTIRQGHEENHETYRFSPQNLKHTVTYLDIRFVLGLRVRLSQQTFFYVLVAVLSLQREPEGHRPRLLTNKAAWSLSSARLASANFPRAALDANSPASPARKLDAHVRPSHTCLMGHGLLTTGGQET